MTAKTSEESQKCYQISDDDDDDMEFGDEDGCLLEEHDGRPGNSNAAVMPGNGHPRGPYERAWSTEATRALIHIRGPMESHFSEGRHKRTALWLQCTRQLQKMGYRYNAAKVQKKWHNILITYNKNLNKKYTAGHVNWDFFEDMFKYLKGKRADCFAVSKQMEERYTISEVPSPTPVLVEVDSKSNDEDFDEDDSAELPDIKETKIEVKQEHFDNEPESISIAASSSNIGMEGIIPKITCIEPTYNSYNKYQRNEEATAGDSWWQEYFSNKLQMERDKIELQKQMHHELMQFNKMSLVQQEKIERMKIDAINSLTNTLQKLVEIKYKKT